MKYLTYLKKKQQMEVLAKELQALEGDPEVSRTQVFMDRLEKLMEDYDMTVEAVRHVLFPSTPSPSPAQRHVFMPEPLSREAPRIHAKREPSVYRNPYTGEVLRTLDPRNATLKEWREKYGMNEVVDWKEK